MNPQCPVCQSEQFQIVVGKADIPVKQCQCGVKFQTDDQGETESWAFEHTYKDKVFRLIFIKDLMGRPEFSMWLTSPQYTLGKEVLRFYFLPNITPANAHTKIPMLLVFS